MSQLSNMDDIEAIDHIEVVWGRRSDGSEIWFLDAVSSNHRGKARGRLIMSYHNCQADAFAASLQWQRKGYRVDWVGDLP